MGCILDKTAYEWETTVTSFEVDMFDRMKLSALMKRHQEIGERHLNEFGTTSEQMRNEQNLSFIFTKINILVHRLPRSEEKVTVRTWCSALKGVRFTRNYVLIDRDGEILTETKAEVTTLDLTTRRIVRPTEINGYDGFLYNDELENHAEYPQKIKPTDGETAVFSRPVRFSDIDYNGHVNNTVYADMALDCLDEKTLRNPIKGFEINFVNEVLPQETVEISVSEDVEGYTFFGNVGEKQSFAAKLKF